LTREEFHFRVSTSLIRLAAGRSPLAIDAVSDLLARFPEKAELVSSYLSAQSSKAGRSVAREVVTMLTDARFQTEWEQAWLLNVLRKSVKNLSVRQIATVRQIASDESRSAFCRSEAIKTLAMHGEISKSLVRRMWSTASVCFHPDLIAAAHYGRKTDPWCESFLAGVKDDPVHKVVVRQLEANQ
jgi:hypothetical protein